MRISTALAAIVGAVALGTTPLHAQTVDAGVVIQSGPVAGHVIIGEPPPVVVYEAPYPEIIVVEHVHVPRGHAYGWWKNHGYRPVTLYYDGDTYYERPFAGRVHLRQVIVYEHEGRFYDAWQEHRRGHHHDEDDDEDD